MIKTSTEILRDRCKREAEEIEAIVEGRAFFDVTGYADFTVYDDASEAPEDALPFNVWDWLEDKLDVQFTASVSSPRSPVSVSVALALGGPSIYLDTSEGGVVGYWGVDRAFACVSQEALDEVFDEVSQCVEEVD